MHTVESINTRAVAEFGRQPTFPIPGGIQAIGVNQRDWLAAVALQGIAAKGLEVQADRAMTQVERDIEMANRAYALADAMLTVRAKRATPNAAPAKAPAH